MSKISCQGLLKSFGSSRVLDNLDLEVPDGAVVTVLGESGSGKTTLLRLIAGFERPDAGTILLDGVCVDSVRSFVPTERRQIGFVPQEGNLFPHLTVAQNVAFGLTRAERHSGRVEELLSLVGMADLGQRYPHQLSGGQQQRVALARALAPHPKLVLLDEPFSSLDASLRSSLRADVMRILRDQHATTVFVTHDQSEALSSADLVAIIQGGRIRQFGSPESLYDSPIDPTIAQFFGEANIVSGTVSHDYVHTKLGKLSLQYGTNSLKGPARVLVRPEQISLRRLVNAAHEPVHTIGQVVHREYYGHDCVVLVDVGSKHLLRVRCPGRTPIKVSDDVVISVEGGVVAWSAVPPESD